MAALSPSDLHATELPYSGDLDSLWGQPNRRLRPWMNQSTRRVLRMEIRRDWKGSKAEGIIPAAQQQPSTHLLRHRTTTLGGELESLRAASPQACPIQSTWQFRGTWMRMMLPLFSASTGLIIPIIKIKTQYFFEQGKFSIKL